MSNFFAKIFETVQFKKGEIMNQTIIMKDEDVMSSRSLSLEGLGCYVSPTKEEAIREKAYYLWEEAGRPECDGFKFWLEAERYFNAETETSLYRF